MAGPTTTHATAERLIYLVDDEDDLLDLAELSLLGDGYELKKFHSAETALASFDREPCKPALLLTDFVMGPMNGLELSIRCKSAYPALKILMVSGTAGPDILVISPGTVDSFMPKPYRPSELARTVRTLLKA